MPGGLMNLASYGQQNLILNGNPSKTFFKSTYAQHTNFGLQKFRVDYNGLRTLRLSEESTFIFKIPRYADLLMDSYISFNLPHIWSPIYSATPESNNDAIPYEFKWIENLGAKMISKITITCGNQTLQEFSGDYFLASVQRDYTKDKKELFDRMIGNVPDLINPANGTGRNGNIYPSAKYTDNVAGAEPSIRGRTLYIPLNTWFSNKSQMAFPLTSLQYNELHITITFRPIRELYTIIDVQDVENNYPRVAPNLNKTYMQFYRFLQSPPTTVIDDNDTEWVDKRVLWDTDIHLNCTYCFLSKEEAKLFALQEQKYLFKQVVETKLYNLTGASKTDIKSLGMVSSYLFYFQRSDIKERNEWSNYTNWPYVKNIPYDIIVDDDLDFTSGVQNVQNVKSILVSMGLLLDGVYRENVQPVGVYDLIEKYIRTTGNAPDGLYCYNFGLSSNLQEMQPSGAINMSRFNQVELEFLTIAPPLNTTVQTTAFCDSTGAIIGINKPTYRIYDYNYDCTIFEERYNMITFVGGNCGLMYAT
jgi:hypothetical protein